MLVRASRRHSQPQGAAQIDKGIPLGRALRAAVLGSLGVELVRRKPINRASGVSRAATTGGIAYQHSPSNGNVDFGATGGLSTVIPSGSPLTIFMRVIVSTLGIRQGLITDHDAAGSNESLTVEITAANQWRASTFGGANEVLGGTVTAGRHDVMVVHRPGTGNQLYVDGVSIGSASFATSLAAGSSLRLGSFGAFSTLGFAGRTEALFIFDGDQSAQFNSLIANPWQVFEPPQHTYLIAPTTGGATDTAINPGVASVTLTGYAPSIARTAHQTVAPGAGSVVITGYAPVVTQSNNQAVAPAVKSIAITGYAPSITQSAAGSISPTTGVITVTGYAPTVTRTAHQAVAPAVGALTITGYAPTITQGLPAVTPNEYSATIMRESIINSQVTALLDRIASQAGTMRDTLNSTTIMRATEVNSVGSMRANDINQTVNIL